MQFTTRTCIALFSGCLLFHLVGTWFIPLIDRDEPRFAEASREMLERHDFVVPFFNNQYRFDKPPLTYWAQALSFRVFGQNDFAARFPSAIAAALVALALFAWGRRIGSNTTGFYAAIIFTLSFQVVEHAKAAVADMWLVLFVTLAHWAGWELLAKPKMENGSRQAWWWIFYASLALGFLAKGPIAWVPLLSVAIFARLTASRETARSFKFVRGILLMLGLVCVWAIPALLRTHGEFFRVGIGRHVVERSFGVIGGHGAHSVGLYLLLLPFYFVTVFLTFFPWSIKLPALISRLRQKRDETDIYLLTGALLVFLIFTFVRTRLLHYTLPAFPLLALLLARMFVRENSVRFLRTFAWIMAPLYVVALLCFAPFAKMISPARELARAAAAAITPDMQIAALDFQEPSLVWYFRAHTHSFIKMTAPKPAQAFMSNEGARGIVLSTSIAEELWPEPPANWKKYSVKGYNVSKGKATDLTLLVKEE